MPREHLQDFFFVCCGRLLMHGAANILQGPPLTDPTYLYDDVYFNPFVIQVVNALVLPHHLFSSRLSNHGLDTQLPRRQPQLGLCDREQRPSAHSRTATAGS